MRRCAVTWLVVILGLAAGAAGWESKAFTISEDFGTQGLEDCTALQYYYYIPCPTSSWFWGFYGWTPGDAIGEFFVIGDEGTAGFANCDSSQCHHITGFRVLDFAGYGVVYPGLYTVRFAIYCCDATGCPVGGPLWQSDPYETQSDWNIVPVDPPLPVTSCCIQPSPPASPRVLVTATHIGSDCTYPQWGCDNVSGSLEQACAMHEAGCLPAAYPRPYAGHYSTVHSGYYGIDFEYCPPVWFKDANDTTTEGTMFGYLELAWRLFIVCQGPDAVEPSSWGSIKAMYR